MSEPQSKGEHVLELAKELLDDIELGRLQADRLLLKATRLARLTGSDEIRKWLKHELNGYVGQDPASEKYMGLTGRWIDRTERKGYWLSLAAIDGAFHAKTPRLQALRVPDSSSIGAINTVLDSANGLTRVVLDCAKIRSQVLTLLHDFISGVYHERLFSGLVQGVFEQYKAAVDARLAGRCGDVLEKFPSVYDRLAEGDPEAVSQALATCRRIIDSFADSIFPATGGTVVADGNTLQLGQQHVQNRINAYVRERTSSDSRRTKLRQMLSNLYARTSSGVHAEVAREEAQALMLQVYLLLGEIVSLPTPSDDPLSNASFNS